MALLRQQRTGPSPLTRAKDFLEHDLWQFEVQDKNPIKQFFYRVARIGALVVQGIRTHDVFLQAAALTYIMVLSLVPFLALCFSVAKGLGAYDYLRENTIEPFLDHTFPRAAVDLDSEDAGTRAAIEKVLQFVADAKFANLGVVGLVFLLFTAQKLLNNVELAFNRIWGVRRSRSFVRRVTDYTALMVVTPILLVTATAGTAAITSNQMLTWLRDLPLLGELFAYFLAVAALWIGFSFLYVCMPNVGVPLRSAIVGGIVGGTLWQLFQVLHVQFQVGVANYSKLYAGFAAFPIFLAWLYVSFVIVLVGALIAWAHQVEPTQRLMRRAHVRSDADREVVALRAAREIAAHFAEKKGPIDGELLAGRIGVPLLKLNEIIDPLIQARVLAATNDRRAPAFVLAQPADTLTLQDLLLALRGQRSPLDPAAEPMAAVLDRWRGEAGSRESNLTLREIVDKVPPGR